LWVEGQKSELRGKGISAKKVILFPVPFQKNSYKEEKSNKNQQII
jgi:hypothetical protein